MTNENRYFKEFMEGVTYLNNKFGVFIVILLFALGFCAEVIHLVAGFLSNEPFRLASELLYIKRQIREIIMGLFALWLIFPSTAIGFICADIYERKKNPNGSGVRSEVSVFGKAIGIICGGSIYFLFAIFASWILGVRWPE